MSFIFFVGGVRSGKSRLAQAWAEAAAPERVLLATCHAPDADMAARIAAHKKSRSEAWVCIEEPLEPLGALIKYCAGKPDFNGSFVLDSLGMLIANLMSQNLPVSSILQRIGSLAETLASPSYSCAIVSEECGLGFVPVNGIARKYVYLLGEANQMMAKKSHAAIFVSCGLPLALKGEIPAVLNRFNSGV